MARRDDFGSQFASFAIPPAVLLLHGWICLRWRSALWQVSGCSSSRSFHPRRAILVFVGTGHFVAFHVGIWPVRRTVSDTPHESDYRDSSIPSLSTVAYGSACGWHGGLLVGRNLYWYDFYSPDVRLSGCGNGHLFHRVLPFPLVARQSCPLACLHGLSVESKLISDTEIPSGEGESVKSESGI